VFGRDSNSSSGNTDHVVKSQFYPLYGPTCHPHFFLFFLSLLFSFFLCSLRHAPATRPAVPATRSAAAMPPVPWPVAPRPVPTPRSASAARPLVARAISARGLAHGRVGRRAGRWPGKQPLRGHAGGRGADRRAPAPADRRAPAMAGDAGDASSSERRGCGRRGEVHGAGDRGGQTGRARRRSNRGSSALKGS
jgi:hypothetical protein